MTKSGKHCGKRILSKFFFCHYVFKKPPDAEASESVYMRERVNPFSYGRLARRHLNKSNCRTHACLVRVKKKKVFNQIYSRRL